MSREPETVAELELEADSRILAARSAIVAGIHVPGARTICGDLKSWQLASELREAALREALVLIEESISFRAELAEAVGA